MAVIDCAIAVGSAVGLEGGAALIGGGAIMGAGAGGLYSAVTGDGNILNSMLNGALLGGGAGALGAAAGLGATGEAAAAGALAPTGGAAVTGGVAPVATYDAGLAAGTVAPSVVPAATVLPEVSGAAVTGGLTPAEIAAGEGIQGIGPNLAGTAGGNIPAASSFWGSGMGTAAKWGAGLMAANAIMSGDKKKYGTLSQDQIQSLPLQYQSNFGTYKPLDTSVMRPMGAPAGYAGTPYGSAGYTGSRVGYAQGGIADANPVQNPSVGSVEQMSRDNALGQNQMFPQANINSPAFANATNTPMGSNMIAAAGDTNVDPYTGAERFAGGGAVQHYDLGGFIQNAAELPMNQMQTAMDNPGQALIGANTPFETNVWNGVTGSHMAPTTDMYGVPTGAHRPHYAAGGIAGTPNLGSYAAGGNPRLLKGPGDGMSDNIPATIGGHQPARLADGEFVVPADVVSHLGNGSTDAGANKLHSMMDKVRKARTGTKKQGKQIKADKFVPK